MGYLVGFPVTLGGFKVDGEGEDGLFRYRHQIGALLFGLLAGTKNGFILIAPDLFKDLLRHQFQLPLRDRNGITAELFGHVVLQNEGTGRVDGSHIALVA